MTIKRYKKSLISFIHVFVDIPIVPIGCLLILLGLFGAWVVKLFGGRHKKKPCLLWASTPIKSLAYMARALRQARYKSETIVVELSGIYDRENFDYTLALKKCNSQYLIPFMWMLTNIRAYLFFFEALYQYDIFHFYFDGGILRRTLVNRFELSILRLAGKKIILMPYGSDAFVYDQIPDPIWRHALLTHYPMHGDSVSQIEKRIRRMTTKADVVVGCLVHFVNLPRWDILPLTCYPIDTETLVPIFPNINGPIRIAHAPNHRGIKGTEFLIEAVERLQGEGHDIKLDIIEKVNNNEAIQRIVQADIFVDQLIFGFALAALEGLALGKIVISGIDDTPAYNLFRQYSYLNECPVVPANTVSIYDVLKNLIAKRDEWPGIGMASRAYVVKRHSYKACAKMFEAIYQKIWWDDKNIDLIDFYHPLFEKKRFDKDNQT